MNRVCSSVGVQDGEGKGDEAAIRRERKDGDDDDDDDDNDDEDDEHVARVSE